MTDEEWQSALGAARAAWPDVRVPDGVLRAHVEARSREGGALPEHTGDLLLACAASRGDPAALRALDERVFPAIAGAVRRIDGRPAFAEEVAQALRVRLLVAEDGAPPRIAEYRGGGPLVAWVCVAAVRAALNMKRAERPAASIEERMSDLVSSEPDPEIRHLKGLYRAQYAEALAESIAALSGRQRALLRLHYVDGVRLARIGELYGVHESTASRWVAAAVEAVADGARRGLRQRLALSPEALGSVERMIQSNLELSLARLLSDAAPPAPAG
jgi:RNA polymerase sigma-70 factor (ECF subfamily)